MFQGVDMANDTIEGVDMANDTIEDDVAVQGAAFADEDEDAGEFYKQFTIIFI